MNEERHAEDREEVVQVCNDRFSGQIGAGICKMKSRIFVNYGQNILVLRNCRKGCLVVRTTLSSGGR